MQCLSAIEFDQLLRESLDMATCAVLEQHLQSCGPCRKIVTELTLPSDAAQWRAAAEMAPALAADDQALLDQLKQAAFPAAGRAGQAVDAGAWLDSEKDKKAPAARAPAQPPASFRFPEVPGFEILGELGRGGMGVVYKARQHLHERIVALKMILAGNQASPEDLGRFHDEAEAVSRLRHPHIVQIFEVGSVEGRFYFVLEFVEGGTLADRIQNKPLPARPSAQLIESLARAMHFAHERGIIHRDLKPANVLLQGRRSFLDIDDDLDRLTVDWDFRRAMPKITDFGLAKLLDRSTGHTASGDVVGTPSYMAPEQAQGKLGASGPAIDVYALGAILYEMLTGKPPFLGPTPMDTLFQVHSQEPVPPRRIVRDIPNALEAICLKCLKKQPEQRYPSADALADDLRHFIEGQPIQAKGINPFERVGKSVRQSSVMWAFVTGALLTAVAVGGPAGYFAWTGTHRVGALRRDTDAILRADLVARAAIFQREFERGPTPTLADEIAAFHETVKERLPGSDTDDLVTRMRTLWSGRVPRRERGYSKKATQLAISHDGRLIFAAIGPAVERWSAIDGEEAPSQWAFSEPIDSLSASNDGGVVGVTAGGAVRLATWNSVRRSHEAAKSYRFVSVSPDGRSSIMVTTDHRVVCSSDESATSMEILKGACSAVVWRPDGQAVAVGSPDGRVTLLTRSPAWNVSAEWKQRVAVSSLAWSRDGSRVVVGTVDGQVSVRETGDRQVNWAVYAHRPGPVAVTVGAGNTLISGGVDGTVRIWDLASGTERSRMTLECGIAQIAASNRERFVILDVRGGVTVWEWPFATDHRMIVERVGSFFPPIAGPTWSSFATLSKDGEAPVQRVDLATGESREWPVGSASGRVIGIRSDGLRVVAGRDSDMKAEVLADARRPISSPVHAAPVRRAFVSETSPHILTWDESGKAMVWHPETGAAIVSAFGFTLPPQTFSVSADQSMFVVGGEGRDKPGLARVRSMAETSEPLSPPLPHPDPVVEARFESPTILRTLDAQHTVRRWEFATGSLIDLPDLPRDRRVLALSPRSDRALLMDDRGELTLWEANNGINRLHPTLPMKDWRCAAFTDDGRWLITGWSDGLRLIHFSTGLQAGPVLSFEAPDRVAVDPTGTRIAAWSQHLTRAWNLAR